jgi:CRISPR-associated protein, Csm2 family
MSNRNPSPPGARGGPAPAAPANEKERIRRIILEGDYQTLVDEAERIGRELARPLTTSQIRNVFGEVKRLQMRFDANRLRMLKPKLAYMGARAGEGGKRLQDVLSTAVDAVFSGNPSDRKMLEERFRRMVDFFEAILAYHKAYGGRDR